MSLILVAIDGSTRSEQAIDAVAARLRGRPSSSVQLLYVNEPPLRYGAIPVFHPRETADALRARRAADVLAGAASRLAAEGIPAATLAEEGELYPTIARVATRLGASEVVLGVRTPWLARVGAALARRLRPLDRLHVPVTMP
jgi:hypothetical protein